MNRKQLTLLIVFGVVLGGLGMWAYKTKQAPYKESTRQMGGKLYASFPLNDVAAITIKQSDGEVNLIKKDDLWTVKERGGYPANFNNISELLRKVWEMKIAKPVRVGQSRLAQLELLGPDKSPSTLLEFKHKDSMPIEQLLLGAKHMRESPANSQWGGGSFPDGRYVMLGNDINSVALISDPMTSAEPRPADWLMKDWLKIENLRSISVTTTNADGTWSLSRESATNDWKLADIKAGEDVDSSKFSSVTSALSQPSFNDVATNAAPEQTGLDHPRIARLETLDGFTYAIKIGGKTEDENYYFQVAVSANLPKERTAEPEEKPEDKERLDKEFAEKKQKQEEKLKAEKAFDGWTYIVSKWTIEPLLKERKDFMADHKEKEETKPGAADTPPIFPLLQ